MRSPRSTTHPLTPHAWATMVTGVNAGRHGIWDFIERDDSGYDLRVINGSYRRAPALWDRLGRVGRRVGLVNIPFVPAPQVEGFAIAGMDAAAREQGMTHPSGLFEEAGPASARSSSTIARHEGGRRRHGLRAPCRGAEGRGHALARRAVRARPALGRVHGGRPHPPRRVARLGAARPRSAVAETYRILDEAVGRLVEAAGGNDIVRSSPTTAAAR